MAHPKESEPRKTVQALAQQAGNNTCADCGAPETTWASYTLGVFICKNCAGIHQNMHKLSQVKSLEDPWDEAEAKSETNMQISSDTSIGSSQTRIATVLTPSARDHKQSPRPVSASLGLISEFMAKHGNVAARSRYEAYVPIYYYLPTHRDCQVLREEWIRAKYERKEFMEPDKLTLFTDGMREGVLWKRGRDNGQFHTRRFVLSDPDGTLKYFKTLEGKEPKCVIKIDSINASLQPTKIGNPNGLQITHRKDSKTRSLFLYHEDGEEIVNWFNAIRMAQFNYLKVAFPTNMDKEILKRMTQNFLKEGYMEKTGPKQTEGFKKRWFTLDHRRLMYFKNPMDAFPKGEVFLGSMAQGYNVEQGLPAGTPNNFTWRHGITIVTPDRNYLMTCETDKQQQSWVQAFREVLAKPMTPQDFAAEAYFRR